MHSVEQGRPFRVLVVDDLPMILAVLTDLLRLLGVAAYVATNAQSATELLSRHPGEIDAAIIDLRMPYIDGVAALALLREIDPGLPCCLLSAVPREIAPLPEGFVCSLRKPFSLEALAGCVAVLRAAGHEADLIGSTGCRTSGRPSCCAG